jgi:hypothetical protein
MRGPRWRTYSGGGRNPPPVKNPGLHLLYILLCIALTLNWNWVGDAFLLGQEARDMRKSEII